MSRRHGPGRRGLRTEKYDRTRSTATLVSSLWNYIGKYVGPIVLSGFLILLYSLTSIASPLIIRNGINQLELETINSFADLLPFAVLFLLLTAIGWVFNSLSTRIIAKINAQMLHEVRMDLYSKLNHSDMDYLKNEQSGNVTARVTSDTDELAVGIQLSTSITSQLLLIIGSFILLFVTNWIIALIALSAIPIAFGIAAIISYFGRKIIIKVRRAFGIVSAKMAEGLSGIEVAKSFNREEDLAVELRELNQKHYEYSRLFGFLMMFVFPTVQALGSILFTMIIYAGGWIRSLDPDVLSLGDIYLSINLSQQFLFPVIMVAMSFPQLEAAFGAMDRIIDIFEAKPSVADKPDADELQEHDDSVHFQNVWFAYNDEEYVLKDITFSAKAGELLAIVGHTGAGKTTLVSSLLTRFYDVDKGAIYIGDQNIKDIKQSSLRNAIGLVTQEQFLFSGTVYDNIVYGAPEATEEDVKNICKRINADEFIEALPEGYETKVVEGGKKLSAGQRQIITIARTMLANPRILVLDEATSRLDAYTESLVQAAQFELFKGRTTFVIAHRLSTISDADKIVVLDHGELIEMGSHEELLEKEGIFAELYHTYYEHQGLAELDISPDELEPEVADIEQLKPKMSKMGDNKEKVVANPQMIKKKEKRKRRED